MIASPKLTSQAPTRSAQCFPVWRTIKLGVYKSTGAYHAALDSHGYQVDATMPWAMIGCAQRVTRVDLVILSVADLGFKEGAAYKDVCACAKRLGLQVCPAELGLALRLSFKDQTPGWLHIAMQPIANASGRLSIFAVGLSPAGFHLLCRDIHPRSFWSSNSRFVFVHRT